MCVLITDGVPELCHTNYDTVHAGTAMLAEGWPDRQSMEAALIDPIEPNVVTERFEKHAG